MNVSQIRWSHHYCRRGTRSAGDVIWCLIVTLRFVMVLSKSPAGSNWLLKADYYRLKRDLYFCWLLKPDQHLQQLSTLSVTPITLTLTNMTGAV